VIPLLGFSFTPSAANTLYMCKFTIGTAVRSGGKSKPRSTPVEFSTGKHLSLPTHKAPVVASVVLTFTLSIHTLVHTRLVALSFARRVLRLAPGYFPR
jgi:hypothetical protein